MKSLIKFSLFLFIFVGCKSDTSKEPKKETSNLETYLEEQVFTLENYQ